MYFREIENAKVYINEEDTEIVITGFPDEESEENKHNCDAMGCSSVEHIIIRAKVTQAGL